MNESKDNLLKIITLGALLTLNFLVFYKVEVRDNWEYLRIWEKLEFKKLIVVCIVISTVPLIIYQFLIEIFRLFFRDPDLGHLLLVIYRYSVQELIQKNLVFIFSLTTTVIWNINSQKALIATFFFVVSQILMILGGILGRYRRFRLSMYPGLIFSYSSSFYIHYLQFHEKINSFFLSK